MTMTTMINDNVAMRVTIVYSRWNRLRITRGNEKMILLENQWKNVFLYRPETAINIHRNEGLESTSEHVIHNKQTRLVRLIKKRNRKILNSDERVFFFLADRRCPNLRCDEIVRSCDRKKSVGTRKGLYQKYLNRETPLDNVLNVSRSTQRI